MNFDFQAMKPLIQKDMDDILESYPTDLNHIREKIPFGGDPYVRKLAIIETAAEECPVRLFGHYPFAFELDVGEARHVCYIGLGNLCYQRSGADFSSLHAFRSIVGEHRLGTCGDFTDHLHRTMDHDKLLAVGFRGVYEECERYNQTETDPQKKRYREMVMRICLAMKKIGLRLRALAKEQLDAADETVDEDVRYNLRRIIDSVNTPWEAPVTMFDALNSILCTTLYISGLDGVEVNAYGSVDRLIQPFYERDLAEGRITKEEAYFLLQCFLHKTDMHCHFNDERKTYDNGVSVMIGGCDLDGTPLYNDITDMVIDAYMENPLINPKLNARASANSPREYLERLAALMKNGGNNLVIENDDYIIPMFERMGLSPEDARTYVGNGCQEVICRNQRHSRAFLYMNIVKVLLDTVKYARSGEELPDGLKKIYRDGEFHADTFEELRTSYLKNLRSYIRAIAEAFAPFETIHHTLIPEPMHSAFTADCMARGQDITEGGARYYNKTLSFVGFGTLCDSLLSLRAAYEAGTVDELMNAVNVNFDGHEVLRQAIRNSENRFGHSEAADEFARQLANDLGEVSRGIYTAHGTEWRTSLFTYYLFTSLGHQTDATPDGRLAGESLSRQMNMASVPDLTSAARSMAALTEADFNDVGMFDFPLPYTVTDSEPFHQALTDYIRTCLELKIPVLQTNVADRQTMIEERDKKGTHPDLIVRVCGYSAIFGQLSREMQDEIIARTEV